MELPPPVALAPYVTRLWVQRIGDGETAYDQPILPDGCLDLVSINGDVVVAGPATRPVTAHLPPGSVTVGVRFRTGAAPPLVGVSAVELRDQEIKLSELWGAAGAGTAERDAEASDWVKRLDVLVRSLVGRLDHAPAIDPVATSLPMLLAERPGESLRRLADEVALSERQLRRRVEVAVGYSPRTLARIPRFQRFLRAARRSSRGRRDLAGLAAEIGYADQAHLTRESRQLAGLPPGAFLDQETQRLGQPNSDPAVDSARLRGGSIAHSEGGGIDGDL